METALQYDTRVDLSLRNNSHTQIVLLTGPGKDVLEVGPATGYVTEALRALGCRVSAVEKDPEAAAIAAEFCERMIVADIEELDLQEVFGEQRFGVAVFGDVLEHLVDPRSILERVRATLQPGGYVVASIPNVAHGSVRLSLLAGDFRYTDLGLLDRTHLRFFTRESVRQLFRDAGYSISRTRRVRLDPFAPELGLRREDFPAYLVNSVRADPNALTYQFVVRAEAQSTTSRNGHRRDGYRTRCARPRRNPGLDALWRVERRTHEYQARIAKQERRLAERTDALQARAGQLERQVEKLEAESASQRRQAREMAHQINLITGSLGYRMLQRVRAVINRVAPRRSPQRLLARLLRRGLRVMLRRGPAALFVKVVRVRQWPKTIARLAREPLLDMDINTQYQAWLKRNGLSRAKARRLAKLAARLSYRPLISIVMPVYNPEPEHLRDAIESVQRQLYPEWELCMADDGSTREGVAEILDEYSAKDRRIKVTRLDRNGGISAASNAALSLATGEFVGLLDHDDELTPDALCEVASLLNRRPDVDYIYSDEDKKEMDGRRVEPFFKPGWSPDLLLSTNYVNHLSVYRKSLIDQVGGFRLGYEGSQDYDLVLRVTALTERIAHIPRPLYSWRKAPGSAASSPNAKTYAYQAAKRAISDALRRRGIVAEVVDGPYQGYYRVKRGIRDNPRIAIIIPTRDKADLLKSCVESVRDRSTYPNYEIIVIDNQSRDAETIRYLESFQGRVIRHPHPFNYSRLMNIGVAEAGCEYVIFLNNDAEVISPGWMEAMLEHGQRPEVAAVGARLFYPDGRVQHEGVFLGGADHLPGHVDHRGYFSLGDCVRNFSAVTAACMLTKASVFRELGGFDERLDVAYNDVDFCLRARQRGYLIVYTPYACLYHLEGATRGRAHPKENEEAFLTRHGRNGFVDPYYNPNLHPERPYRLNL